MLGGPRARLLGYLKHDSDAGEDRSDDSTKEKGRMFPTRQGTRQVLRNGATGRCFVGQGLMLG